MERFMPIKDWRFALLTGICWWAIKFEIDSMGDISPKGMNGWKLSEFCLWISSSSGETGEEQSIGVNF